MSTWTIGSLCEIYSKSEQKWYSDGIIESIGSNWIGVRFNYNNSFKKVKKSSPQIIPIIRPITNWIIGSLYVVYSKSENLWYDDGNIESIGINWVQIRFDNNKRYKKVKKTSNHIMPIIKDNMKLKRGSHCLIYSISSWCDGIIIDILPGDGEWLKVRYFDENKEFNVCHVRRYSNVIKKVHSPWIKLHNIPKEIIITHDNGAVAMINNKEFVIVINCGIYKYNMDKKKWKLFIKYPKNLKRGCFLISYDKINDKLYLYNDNLNIVDMVSHEFNCFPIHKKPTGYTGFVNTEENIHLIGQLCNDADNILPGEHHLIFNKFNQTFTNIGIFMTPPPPGPCAIYIPSKQCILLLHRLHDISVYSLRNKVWSNIYPLRTGYQGWNVETGDLNAILSIDEKHVVIISEYSDCDKDDNIIWILDIGEYNIYHIRRSNIKLPYCFYNTSRRIVQTDGGIIDTLLVFGYIRICSKIYFNVFIPLDIIRLISTYYANQLLHILQFRSMNTKRFNRNRHEQTKHFVIPMQEVLKY